MENTNTWVNNLYKKVLHSPVCFQEANQFYEFKVHETKIKNSITVEIFNFYKLAESLKGFHIRKQVYDDCE